MEKKLRQLSLFDDFSQSSQVYFRVHDKVRVVEVKSNSEIYQYRKHYFNHIIGKTGVVLKVNNNSVLVLIGNESIIFDALELEWIS